MRLVIKYLFRLVATELRMNEPEVLDAQTKALKWVDEIKTLKENEAKGLDRIMLKFNRWSEKNWISAIITSIAYLILVRIVRQATMPPEYDDRD